MKTIKKMIFVVLLILITACSNEISNSTTFNNTSTTTNQTTTTEYEQNEKTIYYINLRLNVPGYYRYQASVKAIQGIVNRDEPRLFIISDNNTYYKYTDSTWMNYYQKQGCEFIELESYEDVLTTFSSYFDGIISFNDSIKSYNGWVSADSDFATMVASLTNYMPVPLDKLNFALEYTDLDLVNDFQLNDVNISGNINSFLTQKHLNTPLSIYSYAFDHFQSLFNQSAYMSLTSESMDYAVQQKMLFVDIKPNQSLEDRALSNKINQYFDEHNDFFQVYGWVDDEGAGLNMISSYGGVIDCVGSDNLSFLHIFDGPNQFKQKAVYSPDYNPNKKYVTFFASEGDTIKYATTFGQGAWLDENRGKVPINWGIIADIVEEFPSVANYLYDSATSNDYFFSGGASMVGFVDIDSQMPASAREAIAGRNRELINKADQKYIDLYNDIFASNDIFEKSVLGNYLYQSGVDGAYGIIPYTPTGMEQWHDVYVYNRRNVFYPRREMSQYVNFNVLNKENANQYDYLTNRSHYWYLDCDIKIDKNNKIGLSAFTQANGDGYEFYFLDNKFHFAIVKNGVANIIESKMYLPQEQYHLSYVIDKASPLDDAVSITVYLNGKKIYDYKDTSNTFTEGGYALLSSSGVSTDVFSNLIGSNRSQAEEIVEKIINDPNKFIVGYYGVVFSDDYTLSQYKVEPGPGHVISLSPTDFYKIKLILDKQYQNQYEIVNMDEFMNYAKDYYESHGTIK